MELDPSVSNAANYNIGAALIQLGDSDSAIDVYRKLKTSTPEDIRLNYNLGVAYLVKKDYALAKQCYLLVYNEGGVKKPSAALGLGIASLLESEADRSQKRGVNYLREAVCKKPIFRDLLMNHSVQDTEENYDPYLGLLPSIKDSIPFKVFKRDLEDGKLC